MSVLYTNVRMLLVVLCTLTVLSGCTKEKAQAVLNAANVFNGEATKAVQAFEDLFVASSTDFMVTDEQRIAGAIKNTATAYGSKNFVGSDQVLYWLGSRDRKIRDSVSANFAEVKASYDHFAAMFVNLPDASYLVDRNLIACAAELGARLANDMAKMGLNLKNMPVPFLKKESDLQTKLNDALKNNNDAAIAIIITQFDALAKEQQKLNDAAVGQAAAAATAGMAAVEAAQQFNTYDIATLLTVTGKALEVITASNVFNLERASKQLTSVQQRLQNDGHWKKILAMKFGDKGTPCNKPEES